MRKTLLLLNRYLGFALILLLQPTQVLAQQTASIKESVYASLVASPEPETLVDEVLEAWLDENGFDALRAHLDGLSTRPDLEVNEHAALGFLWRRIRQPVKALDHWKKATELKPGENALWIERAGQELRLNRFTDAVSSFEQITLPEDPGKTRMLAHSLAFLISQTSDQSAKRILHDWMTSRPNDVVLWLELVDLHGRFSGSEKQWLERLADWRKTVKDPALLIKIRLLEFEELTNQGKPQEAFDVLIAALGETTADSKEEATLLPCVVNLLRQSVNAAPPLKPNLKAFAGTQMQRPAVLLALARELHERGELMQALDLIKALAESRPDDQRIQAAQLLILEENGRWDEALAQLRAGSDKIALALALKDAGQSAEALDALSQLPTSPLSIALRDLIAGKTPPIQEEPETPAFAPPEGTSPSNKFEIGGDHSAEQLRDLFKRWQAVPKDPELTTALLNGWAATGKRAEADHLFRATLMKMESREERLTWVKAMQDLERGYSRYFDFPRALLSVDEDEQDKAEFWLLMAESLHGQMSDTSAWALTQAADHLSGEQALALRLQAAEMWFASNRFAKAILLATELLGSSQGAAAKLLLARIDFREGRTEQARRTMWALADHPAMTATRALEMARELVQWQEAAEAAAFVALQRQRFPEDEALRTFQLERALDGNLTEPFIEMLLKMGSSQDPRGADSQGFGVEWARLQSAIAMIHAKELRGERPFEMTKRYRNELGINKAYFAMAHLLRHAQRTGLDLTKRTELAERAEAAGLPFPTSLIWARIHVNDHGQTTLIPALDQLEKQPVEEWADAMALHYQQRLMEQPTTSAILTPQDHRILNTLLESLNVNDPGSALKLSFHWWRLHPEVSDSETALRTSLNLSEASTKQMPNQLHSLLMSLSPKQKTHPFMKEVSAVLLKWLETQDSKSESYSSSIFQVAACLFQLNQWQQAADLAERGWLLPGGPGLATIPQIETNVQPPSWVYWNSQSPLVWPPNRERSGLSAFSIFLTSQPPIQAGSLIVPQEERTPFLAAGAKLTPYPLRLLWLLAGGDDEGAKTLIKDWQKETPDSVVATRLMAAVVASEGKLEEALELLHGMIAAHGAKSPEKRQHQVHYLRAALSPPAEFDPFSGGGLRPPPNQHRERVQQILRELQPELETWPPYTSNWLPVFKAAGIEEATAGWNQLNQVSHQTEEMSEWTILQASSNSRVQRQVEMAFTPHRISSYEVARLIQTGFRPQALVLLLRALKAEGDQTLLRPESSQGDWFQLLQQHPDLREDVLKAAGTLRRHRPRELNQAIHLAMASEAWQQVVDWGSEAQVIVDANPYLKSRVDLARLELGMRVDELAKELSSGPIHSQTERFRILMSSIHHPRSFKRLILLTELFVTLAEQSPPLPLLGGNEASSLANTALQALSRSYSLPNNAGVIPPLYPELEPNPSERSHQTPPDTITAADLTKRRALHGRLCDLAFANPTWFPFSLPHLLQRHLIENQPTHEALVERLSQLRNDPTKSSHFNLDQLARTGHPWRDVSLRLRLAKLLRSVLATSVNRPPSARPHRRQRQEPIESLITLIGGEVKGEADLPLWALWEYPFHRENGDKPHTAEQIAWNKQRHQIFDEFTKWGLEQEDYRATIFPIWAVYHLFFEGVEDAVFTQALRLKEQPADPYALKAFVKASLQAYPNTHNLSCAGLILRLIDELPEGEVDPAITQPIINLLVNGHNRKSLPLPSIDLSPEKVNLKQHNLTPEQQQRRVELVNLFSAKLPLAAQPPNLLLSRLFREMSENSDTKMIEEALSEIGKTDPALINAAILSVVESVDFSLGVTVGTRIKTTFLRIAERYVDQAAAKNQPQQFLWQIMRPYAISPFHEVDPFPPPSGRFKNVDPYVERPSTWSTTDPIVLKQRRQNFLRALKICARDPDMLRSSLSDRLAEQLLDRRIWPQLLAEMKDYYVQDENGCSDALKSWLWMEAAYFDIERVSFITDFLIQWLDVLKTIEGSIHQDWLANVRYCYTRDHFNRDKDDGRDPRERVVLAPHNWPLYRQSRKTYPANPESDKKAASLKESWLRLLNRFEEVPSALRVVFPDLIATHLERDPTRLAKLAMRLTKEDFITHLERFFRISTDEHRDQPFSFRLALVEFFLHLPAAVDGNSKPGEEAAALTLSPEVLIKYLKMQKSSSQQPTALSQAELGDPVLINRRNNLITKLEQLLARDPKKLAADRITSLLQGLTKRRPNQAEIDQVLTEAKAEPEGVLRALKDHVGKPHVQKSQLSHEQLTGNLTQGELLVAVAEAWPTEMDESLKEWWIALTYYLRRSQTADSENHAVISQLQERLMTAAMAKGSRGELLFGVYAAVSNNTPEGRAGLTKRVRKLIQQSPIEADRLLSILSSAYSSGSEQPLDTILPILELGRDWVRDWPKEAEPETLNWVIGMIDLANKTDIALVRSRWMQNSTLTVSPYPASHPSCQRLIGEMLLSLQEHKTGAPLWVGPARLRLSARQSLTLTELGEVIRPFFKDPWLTHILRYYDDVLNKRNYDQIIHPNIFRNRTNFVFEPLEELRDLLRCLAAAAHANLLPETEVSRLANEIKAAEARLNNSLLALKRQQVEVRTLTENFQDLAAARFQGEKTEHLALADLPASILSSLINKQPVSEIIDRVWEIVQSEPQQGTVALEKWAASIGKDYPFHAYCESGKLTSALTARWHAKLPAPNWAVVFLNRWNSYGWAGSSRDGPTIRLEHDHFMPISAEIRPQIQAQLKRFPTCIEDNYFPTVVATSHDPLRLPNFEMVGIAVTHLQAQLAANRRPSILSDSPPANTIQPSGERTNSLNTPLSAPSALWFLIEHTVRFGKNQAIEDLLVSADLTNFIKSNDVLASLLGLFLGPENSFVSTAVRFHAAVSAIEHKHDPFIWVLRIALLREIRLTWEDWLVMAPAYPMEDSVAYRGVQLRHWLLYLAVNGQLNNIDKLVSYCREMTKGSPFQTAREAPINDSPKEVTLGNLRLPHNPFKSDQWNRVWESLVMAAQVADTWPSTVITAEQLGLLESTRHYDCFAPALTDSFWSARNVSSWFAYLEPTGLAKDGAEIQWFWVKGNGQTAWLWRLPHFLASKDKTQALVELGRRQQGGPTLGRALLRLAVLNSISTITADQLTQELTPVISELERQPAAIHLAICGTLHGVVPRLPENITAAPLNSVLRRLALPDQADATSAEVTFWLADDAPLPGQPPAPFQSWTNKLASDLRLLILNDDARSHDVLVRGLQKITKLAGDASTGQMDLSMLTTVILRSVANPDTVGQSYTTRDRTREGIRNDIRIAGFLAAHWPSNVIKSPEYIISLEQTANLRSSCLHLPYLHHLDGRAIAHELLYLTNAHRPEAALVFLDPFRDLVLRVPVGATATLLDTLREFAGEDPSRQCLLWALDHTVATLGGPAAAPVPWPPYFAQRWQDPDCPPLVRYWLATVVSEREAKTHPQALFEAAAYCCQQKSYPTMVDHLLKIELRPIVGIELSPRAKRALAEFVTVFCQFVAGLNQDVNPSSTTDKVIALYDRLFQPILERLKEEGDLTLRSELVDHLAKAGLMPLSLAKQELEEGLDPTRLALQAPMATEQMSRQPRAHGLPDLTAQSAEKLQAVITPSSPMPLRTLQFLLLLGPDSPIEPPSKPRAQRIAEWEPILAANPSLRTDSLRNLLFFHWYSDDMLPILEKDGAVRTFMAEATPLSYPTESFRKDQPLLSHHALLSWRIKRDSSAWLRVLERDALSQSLYPASRASDTYLCGYLADTIITSAPSEWDKEVPLLIATLESPYAEAVNPTTCHAFATLAAAFSNDPMVSRLAEVIASANPKYTQDLIPFPSKHLWAAIANHPDLTPVVRLQCVLPPWRTASNSPVLLERLIAMHSLGLLDPVAIAKLVDAIDSKAVALPIYPLVRWLYHCKQTDAAHRLIAKVLKEVSASDRDPSLEWALVAELCHHTGRPDLTKAAIERASPPQKPLPPTAKLIIDRLNFQ